MGLLEKIYDSGMVGCGGAGFPTHIKLNTEAEYFIINGLECEPLLRTDRFIMKNFADEVIITSEIVGKQVGAKKIIIGLKNTYEREIEILREAILRLNSNVRLHLFENFYPAGDEQVLIYEVTGRTVPSGGLPSQVGVVVSNVSTVYGISNSNKDLPFTHKFLTVTGEVRDPMIIHAPIGAPIISCIEATQAHKLDYDVILGGPLMGKLFSKDQLEDKVVTKTSSGIIVLDKDSTIANSKNISIAHMIKQAKSACIQCTLCTEMCPRYLLGHPLKPHKIMRKLAFCSDIDEILNNEDVRQAQICSECGVCEVYSCPMGLKPRTINSMIKKLLIDENAKYSKSFQDSCCRDNREYRRVPSKRIASRLDIKKYYDFIIDKSINLESNTVKIPLKQHIGKPSIPVVSIGQHVIAGQLIAKSDVDSTGANVHASIDGRVVSISDKIIVER